MLISVVFPAGRCTRYLPFKQKAPTAVRPWFARGFSPRLATRRMLLFFFLKTSPPRILNISEGDGEQHGRRWAALDRRRLEPRRDIIVFWISISPPLSASMDDPELRKRLKSAGVYRSPQTTDWLTGNRRSAGTGCSRTCYSWGQRANK